MIKLRLKIKLKVLTDASAKMAERIYAKKAAEGQALATDATTARVSKKADEGVVDAEFEEVKEG